MTGELILNRVAFFVVWVAVGLFVPTCSFAADFQSADSTSRQLKKMSKLERDQFDRNLAAFQQLNPEQKAQYQKLHDDLQQERKEGGGNLNSLMETYSVWLLTLTPSQRDELQRETDLAKKIAIVRRLKEDQDRVFEHHDMHQDDSMSHTAPKNIAKMAMDKKDLDALFRALVDALPIDRRKSEFEDLGLNTYLSILHESILMAPSSHEWPGDFLSQKILNAVRRETAKEILRSSSKRDAMIRMMLTGILKLASDQIHDPTAEERFQILLSLTPEERAKINKLSDPHVRFALRKKYFESKGEEGRKQLNQMMIYRRQIVDYFDQLGVELPPILKKPDRAVRGKG